MHLAILAEYGGPSTEMTHNRQHQMELEAIKKATPKVRRLRRQPADLATIRNIAAENVRKVVGFTSLT